MILLINTLLLLKKFYYNNFVLNKRALNTIKIAVKKINLTRKLGKAMNKIVHKMTQKIERIAQVVMRFNLMSFLAKFLDPICQRIIGKSDTSSNVMKIIIYLPNSEINNIYDITKKIIAKKRTRINRILIF